MNVYFLKTDLRQIKNQKKEKNINIGYPKMDLQWSAIGESGCGFGAVFG